MTQIKLGFIGCGAHATRNLQPCIPLVSEIEFVATCDLEIEKAECNAKRFGARQWYADYNEKEWKAFLNDADGKVGKWRYMVD